MFDRIENLAQSITAKYWEHEKERWHYESERIRVGGIDDESKLRLLKDYMFSRVHGDRDVSQLIKAIQVLENSIERKHQRQYHPYNLLGNFIGTLLTLSFLAGCFSFPITAICKQSEAPICNTSRLINYIIVRPFLDFDKK